MQNLNFNDGLVRLAINGDESRVITINPTDFGLISRFEEVKPKLDTLLEEYSDGEKSFENLEELDKRAREIIDYAIGSPVSDVAFGSTNCLSLAGGTSIFENFLTAYAGYLEPKIKEEFEKSKSRIEKYTKQVK